MQQLIELCNSLLADGSRGKLDKYDEEKPTVLLNRQKPHAISCRWLGNAGVLGGIPTYA